MPRVPETPLSTVRARGFGGTLRSAETPESMGAGVGRALTNAGNQLSGIAGKMFQHELRMKEREDELTSKKAYVQASNQVRQLLNDPESGLYNRMGENSRGVTRNGRETLEEIRKGISKSLTPRQAQLFDNAFEVLRNRSLEGLSRHEARQFRQAEADAEEALKLNAISDAAANATDPNTIRQSRQMIGQAVMRQANLHGWSSDKEVSELFKATSALHAAVIDTLVNNPSTVALAEGYFESNKDELIGTQRGRVEGLVQRATRDIRAQEAVDNYIQTRGLGSETAALSWARKTYENDPGMRKAVVAGLKTRFSEVRTARTEYRRNLSDQYDRDLSEAKGDWSKVPLEAKRRYEAEYGELKMARDATAYRKYLETQEYGAKSDPEEFERLLAAANISAFDGLNDVDLINIAADKREYNRLVNKRISLKRGDNKDAATVTKTERKKIATQVLLSTNPDFDPTTTTDKKNLASMEGQLGMWAIEFQEKNEREPNEEEMKREANRLIQNTVSGTVDQFLKQYLGIGYDQTPLYKVDPNDRADITVSYDQIPKKDLEALHALARRVILDARKRQTPPNLDGNVYADAEFVETVERLYAQFLKNQSRP